MSSLSEGHTKLSETDLFNQNQHQCHFLTMLQKKDSAYGFCEILFNRMQWFKSIVFEKPPLHSLFRLKPKI